MFETIVSSFGLVALSEMGDKTQLLAFSLAAKFRRPVPVLLGIFVATVANHLLASVVGNWVAAQVSPKMLTWFLGSLFIAFALWTLKPDTLDSDAPPPSHLGAFVTTCILFFLAEMGDKTQLATVALAAQFHSVMYVTIGTTLGMLASDGIAVFLGDRFSTKINMKWARYVAALTFAGFGVATLLKGFSST